MKDLSSYRLFIFGDEHTLRKWLVPDQFFPQAPNKWDLLPGVRERLTDGTFDWQRRHIFAVVSNQPGISVDCPTEPVALHMLISTVAVATGVYPRSRAIQICPHLVDEQCECRLPAPGMLKVLMDAFHASPDETVMIGSTGRERDAACAVGVAFVDAWEFFGWGEPGEIELLADLTREQIVAGANQLGRKGMNFASMLERSFRESFTTEGPFHPDWQSPAYGAPRFPLRMINFPKPSPHHYHINPLIGARPEPDATSEDIDPEAATHLLAGRQLAQAILRCQMRNQTGTCDSSMKRVEDDTTAPQEIVGPQALLEEAADGPVEK